MNLESLKRRRAFDVTACPMLMLHELSCNFTRQRITRLSRAHSKAIKFVITVNLRQVSNIDDSGVSSMKRTEVSTRASGRVPKAIHTHLGVSFLGYPLGAVLTGNYNEHRNTYEPHPFLARCFFSPSSRQGLMRRPLASFFCAAGITVAPPAVFWGLSSKTKCQPT